MKFRVINLRSMSNYFLKVVLLVAITIVLSIGVYYKKNVNVSIPFNSSKLLKIINSEIALFKNFSNNDKEKNLKFSEYTIGKEFGIIRTAKLQTLGLTSYNNSNNIDEKMFEEQESQNNEEINENIQNSEETTQTNSNAIDEPAVRIKYRSTCFKCSR